MLAAALSVNGMLWKTSPAATEMEVAVLDWLRQMMGLPEGLFGVIQDTASASTLVALAAAREAVPGLDGAPPRAGGPGAAAHVRLRGGALLDREGRASSSASGRTGCRKIPTDAAVPHGRGRAAARHRRRPRGGLHAVRGDGQRRNDLHHQHRPRAPRSRRSALARACGCTWTRPTAARAALDPGMRHVLDGASSGRTRWW